jgi:glycosyltransferase involved in cell wall biosynthesis
MTVDGTPRGRVPRIAIAHEWLVAYGGSERCVEEMLATFPGAQLLTTLADISVLPAAFARARPSVLQRIPEAASHHEWLLPLMPLAWRLQTVPPDVEAVVSSSHACAKAVSLPPGVPHLCYCHTPMRYAWSFASERDRFPRAIRPAARAGAAWLRHWDRASSRRVTRFLANSRAVARRVADAYGRQAEVVPPPVRTDFFTPAGEREEFFLYVGRLVGYKRPDLAVDAFATLPYPLVVVGDGHFAARLRERATPNVRFLSGVGDEALRDLYRRARALVHPALEDFGIAMAEAQACGAPVIGLRGGGAADIVDHGNTGWLVDDQGLDALRHAVRRAAEEDLDPATIRVSAERFSAERFRERMLEAVVAMVRDPRPV